MEIPQDTFANEFLRLLLMPNRHPLAPQLAPLSPTRADTSSYWLISFIQIKIVYNGQLLEAIL